jgi:hypothetical protein
MRKHRSDSKLWNLDEDVQRQIYDLRSCSLRDLVAKCESEFGFQTSLASLSTWLREKHVEMLAESRASAAQLADDVEKDAEGKVDRGVQIQLGQLAFDAAMLKDPRMLRTAYGLLLQKQSQEMERQRLAEASRTDRERAVSALLEEAKGNDEAKALLQQFVSALGTKP